MHFTTRSAPTVQPTIGFLPWSPFPYPSRRLTPDYVQLDARRPPGASGELISVISRSCNLSRLLHGQLIIIAIPISGAIRRTARRAGSSAGNRGLTPPPPARRGEEAIPMPLSSPRTGFPASRFFQFRAARLASDSPERAQLDSCCCVTPRASRIV